MLAAVAETACNVQPLPLPRPSMHACEGTEPTRRNGNCQCMAGRVGASQSWLAAVLMRVLGSGPGTGAGIRACMPGAGRVALQAGHHSGNGGSCQLAHCMQSGCPHLQKLGNEGAAAFQRLFECDSARLLVCMDVYVSALPVQELSLSFNYAPVGRPHEEARVSQKLQPDNVIHSTSG